MIHRIVMKHLLWVGPKHLLTCGTSDANMFMNPAVVIFKPIQRTEFWWGLSGSSVVFAE